MFVTSDVYMSYPHLVVLVDIDVDNYLVGVVNIVVLYYFYIGIFESLVVEISLYDQFSPVYHVRCDLVAFYNANLALQIVHFAFLHSIDIDLRHTWS